MGDSPKQQDKGKQGQSDKPIFGIEEMATFKYYIDIYRN